MAWWALVVQLIVGAATIGVAFRVGTRNTRVNQQIGTRNAQEAANATHQREVAARREEFWKRFTYALTVTGSPNPADARVGFRLLGALISSDLATEEDVALAESISQAILAELDQAAPEADTDQ
jgi:hypothetical protein